MTEPLPTDPLLTTDRLAVWAQERPLLDLELATAIIESVTVLLRLYGSGAWTAATIPPRARDIGYIVAKDYYLNPRQLRQETTGPLQESVDDSTLNGLNFTDAQKAELATLGDSTPETIEGLWTMSYIRGAETTIHKTDPHRNVVLFDTRAGWPIEYLNEEDAVVFFPEEA